MEQNEIFKAVSFDKKKYEKFMKYYKEDIDEYECSYYFEFEGYNTYFVIGFWNDAEEIEIFDENNDDDYRFEYKFNDKNFRISIDRDAYSLFHDIINSWRYSKKFMENRFNSDDVKIFWNEVKKEFDKFIKNKHLKEEMFLYRFGLNSSPISSYLSKYFYSEILECFPTDTPNNKIIYDFFVEYFFVKNFGDVIFEDEDLLEMLNDIFELKETIKNDPDSPFLKEGYTVEEIFEGYEDKETFFKRGIEYINDSVNDNIDWYLESGTQIGDYTVDGFIENYLANKKDIYLPIEDVFEMEQFNFDDELEEYDRNLFKTGSLKGEVDLIEFFYKNCRKEDGSKYTIVEIVEFLKDKCIELFESDPEMYDNLFNDYEKEVKDLEKYIVEKDYKKIAQEKVLAAVDKVNLKSSVDDILNELPENFKVELFNVIRSLKNKEINNSEAYLLNALISKLIELKKITSQEEVQKTVNKLLKMQHKYELRMLSEAITNSAMKEVEQGENKRRR